MRWENENLTEMSEKDILSAMSGPNPWTPELEKLWNKLSSKKLTKTYPENSIGKPRHLTKQRKRFVI